MDSLSASMDNLKLNTTAGSVSLTIDLNALLSLAGDGANSPCKQIQSQLVSPLLIHTDKRPSLSMRRQSWASMIPRRQRQSMRLKARS
jgi:hypothetical protein